MVRYILTAVGFPKNQMRRVYEILLMVLTLPWVSNLWGCGSGVLSYPQPPTPLPKHLVAAVAAP